MELLNRRGTAGDVKTHLYQFQLVLVQREMERSRLLLGTSDNAVRGAHRSDEGHHAGLVVGKLAPPRMKTNKKQLMRASMMRVSYASSASPPRGASSSQVIIHGNE